MSEETTNRRTVLKRIALGSVGGGLVIYGGYNRLFESEEVLAQIESFNVNIDDESIITENGLISSITLNIDNLVLDYENVSDDEFEFDADLTIAYDPDNNADDERDSTDAVDFTLDSQTYQVGETPAGTIDLFNNESYELIGTEQFEEDYFFIDDGETQDFTPIEITLELDWVGLDETQSEIIDFTLTVTNEAVEGSVSGDMSINTSDE